MHVQAGSTSKPSIAVPEIGRLKRLGKTVDELLDKISN
jgi:hypothetical protein